MNKERKNFFKEKFLDRSKEKILKEGTKDFLNKGRKNFSDEVKFLKNISHNLFIRVKTWLGNSAVV